MKAKDFLLGDTDTTTKVGGSEGLLASSAAQGRGASHPSAGPASGAKARATYEKASALDGFEGADEDQDRPYFVAHLNEEGILDHADKEKQFIIPGGSEVRFHLNFGTKIARGARLLVNKPKRLPNGEVEYTITQPLSDKEEAADAWAGSELDSQYLEAVDADPEASQYQLEFRVFFAESGSFFVQIAYEDALREGEVAYSPPQYINVEPVMTANSRVIRGKELSVLTVMSRCLGKMSRWPAVLRNVRELGYNAVHFAPFQKYGQSYSHYSLADQTTVDDCFFESPASMTRQQRLAELKGTLDGLRQEGLLSMVDIVLNHTANDSTWIVDHPEATYNTDDCPHLWAAWELDSALQRFTKDFAQRKVPECPSAPYIKTEADLAQVMHVIQTKFLDGLRLHEFFLCDVQRVMRDVFQPALRDIDPQEMESYRKSFEQQGWFSWDKLTLLRKKLSVGHGSGPKRMNVSLKMPDAAMFFMLANKRNPTQAAKEVEALLGRLNDDWTARAKGFLAEARGAIEGNIRYFKIECGKSLINLDSKSEQNWILDPYFSELQNSKKSKVAHNGWVMGHNCMEDFGYVGWHYLRRTINIWGDCIKLRYGSCPADSPYLWQHMTQYVQDLASVADGFRLDNTHSTPIHVAEYLLQQARSKNNNLFVMAELFTSSAELDGMFCRKLNLNAMVRELQNRGDTKSLGDYFHRLTCQQAVLGAVDGKYRDLKGRAYSILHPGKPQDVLYDCTHDNPSVVEKFQTGRIALPHIGLSAVSDMAIASTWGYDQLVGEQIHCVSEKRTYPVVDHRPFSTQDPTVYPARGAKKKAEAANKDKQAKDRSAGRVDKAPQPKKADPFSITAGNSSQQKPAQLTSFEHEFRIDRAHAHKVTVAGEFNGWKQAIHLQRQGASATWKAMATLPIDFSKQAYQYKFVVNDTEWVLNDALPTAADPQGHLNNCVPIPKTAASAPYRAFNPAAAASQVPASTGQIARSSTEEQRPDEERIFDDLSYARLKLNQVHEHCTRLDAEIFMHQQCDDVLVVSRQLEPDLYQDFDCYVSITRFCFYNKGGDCAYKQSIELPGFMSDVVFAGYLEIPDSVYADPRLKDATHVYGPRGCKLLSYNHLEGKFCSREKLSESKERLNFHFMPPSFTCVIKVKSRSFIKQAVAKINAIDEDPRLETVYDGVPQSGLNHVLFRCEPEEKDISAGARGPYGFDQYGQLPYAGIASLMHMLRKTKHSKDMGAEIFENMRAGDWLLDYTVQRIRDYAQIEPAIGLQNLADFLGDYVEAVKQLPAHLKPKYGTKVIETAYNKTVKEIVSKRMLDDFMAELDDPFVQKLALAVYQMYGRIPSVYFKDHKDSMCAGLTHFSTGYMRCWGRDTFIALRGLLIVTGLEEEARDTILFFAKVYRHGLLPNLHDGGGNTRFNSRDAPWFFLQAIKDYILVSEEKEQFLNQSFELHFKDDDQLRHDKNQRGRTLTILELIIEIVQRHAQGIEFREWNAGERIDAHMKDDGFNVKIRCDLDKTGFCFGGNKDNCGTWMDKMGSSADAGNKGKPATPRDGAPIELVAMQFSILSWLATMHSEGKIKQSSVSINHHGRPREVRFADWAKQMADNFERCFWVPQNKNDDRHHDVDARLVNRRGIYKDVYGSSDKFTDYQLRCNICIAMSYAPELFDRQNAQVCLENVANILMEKNCMGIKTLDPKDRQYNGDYVNSDASHGINYHQGPEWVWPVGFFLKAQLIFKGYATREDAVQDTMKWLLPHKDHILKNRWQGLPELTNSHGQHCPDSCVTQAWSISTIVDAMRDLYYYQREDAE